MKEESIIPDDYYDYEESYEAYLLSEEDVNNAESREEDD